MKLLGVKLPESVGRYCDVSQSTGRCCISEGRVSAVTLGGKKLLTHRGRFLPGVDASLWFPSLQRLEQFDDSFLMNLAGNAFEGSRCAASLLVSLAVLAHSAAERHKSSVAHDPEEESEAELEAVWLLPQAASM